MSFLDLLNSGAPIDLSQIPAAKPPKGVKSNFINPESLGPSLAIVHAVFLAVCTVAVAIRFWKRKPVRGRRYDWSDATCLLAFIGSIVHTALTIHNTTINYGRHLWDIPALSMTRDRTMKYTAVELIYVVTTYSIKFSLLLLFHRLFWVHQRAVRAIQFGFVLITVLSIPHLALSIVRVVECSDVAALGRNICKNHIVSATNLLFGSFAVVTDFFILAIPLALVRTLKIKRKEKFGVMAVFLAGFVACAMSITRIAILATESHADDPLYVAARVSYFSAVEVKIAIICSCAPSFPAFFRRSNSGSDSDSSGLTFGRSNRSAPVVAELKHASSSDESDRKSSKDRDMVVLEQRQLDAFDASFARLQVAHLK